MADTLIWVASYQTESGDRGVVGYWTSKPSEEKLEKYFRKLMPDDFPWDDDAGEFIPYVYWDVHELEKL